MKVFKKKLVQKIYKYPTGATIPKDAVYLSTQVEKEHVIEPSSKVREHNVLVWHYFLVKVEEEIEVWEE